ncbi:MAG TPA: amidohydrolase family protein, partial [Streptosporangiaceae bacterium]
MSDTKADLAFVGGKIRTPAHPSGFVQALAVRGGVIQALGTDADIRDLTGPGTRVVDLRGRLALPAFGDAHVHPVGGGLESLRCNLLGLRNRPEYLDVIAAYSASLPPDAWVLGGGWTMAAFPGGLPTAADLDPITGGRPAFLPNRDHHSAWVNTVALERAGIDAHTPDPPDGRIERDEAGRPTGTLHDGAMRVVAAHLPSPSTAELRAGLLAAQAHLHSLGITRFQDACVGTADELGIPDAFETYRQAAEDGTLTCHVVGALWWDRGRGLGQIDD